MEDGQLPAELERLERLLASGPRPEPSPELRERVLSGAWRQVRRRRVFLLASGVFATAAATVLMGVGFAFLFLAAFSDPRAATRGPLGENPPTTSPGKSASTLAVRVADADGLVSGPQAPPPPIAELARRIRRLSPEISVEESVRRATLLQLGTMAGGQSILADLLRKPSTEKASQHGVHDPR